MIDDQHDNRAYDRDKHAPQVEAGYPGAVEMLEQPAADHPSDNPEQDVDEETLPPALDDLAGDIARNEPENDPAQD